MKVESEDGVPHHTKQATTITLDIAERSLNHLRLKRYETSLELVNIVSGIGLMPPGSNVFTIHDKPQRYKHPLIEAEWRIYASVN